MSQNPLLDFSGLTRFAEIKPEHISPPSTNCCPPRAPR